MNKSRLMLFCGLLCLLLALTYLLFDSGLDTEFILPNRLVKLLAMLTGAIAVACSTLCFQTITENRMLTPAIMGYESVYLLWQALLVLLFGLNSPLLMDLQLNFVCSALVLLCYSLLLQRWLFSRSLQDVWQMLWYGLVFSLVGNSLTQFFQYSSSPAEFSLLSQFSLASFQRAELNQTLFSALLTLLVATLLWRQRYQLDVLQLGAVQASALGVNRPLLLQRQLALIAILVAISTSLLGPTAFFGILIANLSATLSRSQSHRHRLPLAAVFAVMLFLLAQLLVEHLFNFKTSVGLLLQLCCGGYFLMFLIRQRQTS
jgi:iron complex transport system permease protein